MERNELINLISEKHEDVLVAIKNASVEELNDFVETVKELIHEYDTTRGLYCTDKKECVPEDDRGACFFQLHVNPKIDKDAVNDGTV